MTYQEIAARLSAAGIENALAEARMLVAHASGKDERTLGLLADQPIADPTGWLADAVASRCAREPLQYILGTWYFWRQEYEVSPHCLIPRSDTECLLEIALKRLPQGGRFLDLCTGSGCIAISLLCERPDASAVAVELYPETLALAKRNAAKNGITCERLTLLQGDVLQGNFLSTLGQFDLIISNPPYIPSADIPALAPEVKKEPLAALDGGEDGLTFYRRILTGNDYSAALRKDGAFCFEIGYDQADAMRTLTADVSMDCHIFKDLGGCDRVAVVQPHGIPRIY